MFRKSKDFQGRFFYLKLNFFITSLIIISTTPGLNAQIKWNKYNLNPVVDVSPGEFDSYDTGHPMVMRDGDTLKIWYAGSDGSACPSWRIAYATSAHGINWSKQGVVLDVGTGWEQCAVMYPCVLQVGDTLKMWYAGHDGIGWHVNIGYAWSLDGKNWTKDTSNPVFPGSSVDGGYAIYPGTVLKEGSTYKMWYEAASSSAPLWHIRYATSPDGRNWTDSGDSVLVRRPGEWDDKYVQKPTVLKKEDGTYEMWYVGVNGSTNERSIGYAISSDGIDWPDAERKKVLTKGTAGDWDDNSIAYSTVMLEDSTYKMWFQGFSSSSPSRIGYATSPRWEELDELNQSRFGLRAAAIGDTIYACGGHVFDDVRTVEKYCISTNTWSNGAVMSTERSYLGIAAVGGKIYVFGGYRPGAIRQNTTECYNPATGTWQAKANMPFDLTSMAVAVHGGKIYTFGGERNGENPCDEVYRYDPSLDSWEVVSTVVPTPRKFLMAATVDDKIYVLGGYLTPPTFYDVVEVYDPSTNTWSSAESIPIPLANTGVGVWNNKIYLYGGEVISGGANVGANSLYIYDTMVDSKMNVHPL